MGKKAPVERQMMSWWSTGAFDMAGCRAWVCGAAVRRRKCEEQVEMVESVLKGIGDEQGSGK